MAAALLSNQDSANQVGGSFVTQYYNMLHQHPDQVYQFYKEDSTMTRIDGNYTETSNGIIEIHSIISKLKFSSIEIKTANFLNSLMGGIMVMVSGLVQAGQYEKRRKFIQSFFLATQETGYFILNDFFHYVDEEYFCTPALLAQGSYENVPVPETGYSLDIVPNHENEIVGPTQNGDSLNNYDYSYQNEISETLISSFNNVDLSDQFMVTTTPLSQEPIRHTYASILKSKVEDSKQIGAQLSAINLEQQFDRPYTSLSDKSSFETPPENNNNNNNNSNNNNNNNNNNFDYEVEAKSVFVKNVTVYLTEADLENEFKKFGKIKPDGVAIRSHKETGKYYAFVEYEDAEGVQNALKAAQVDIDGWRVYVEQRKRPKNATFFRGRGRGRGGRFNGRGRGRFRVNGFFEDEDPNPLTQAKQYRQKYQSY